MPHKFWKILIITLIVMAVLSFLGNLLDGTPLSSLISKFIIFLIFAVGFYAYYFGRLSLKAIAVIGLIEGVVVTVLQYFFFSWFVSLEGKVGIIEAIQYFLQTTNIDYIFGKVFAYSVVFLIFTLVGVGIGAIVKKVRHRSNP